jgi:excisionase family DNA binding protein
MTRTTATDYADNRHPMGLMDITAVAARLGVSVRHVRRLVHERRIPYIKWGHLIRFDANDIEQWLEAARVSTGQPLQGH